MNPITTKECLGIALSLLVAVPSLHADSGFWNGDTSAAWSDLSNWDGSLTAVPGAADTATFDVSSANTTVDLGAGGGIVTLGTLTFDTAGAAAYTIGENGGGNDLLILADNGETVNISMTSSVANDQTIDADIQLGLDAAVGDYQFNADSETNKLIINGDMDTVTGGTAGIKRIELGDFNAGDIGLIEVNGNISNTGGAQRIYLFPTGADVTLGGQVAADIGNTMRTFVNHNGTLTVTGTGVLGQGNLELRYGTVNLNNVTTPQFFDNDVILGSNDQANGDATLTLAAGATMEINSNIQYRADDNTDNIGRIENGTIVLDGANRVFLVNNHANIAATTPELTITSKISNDGGDRDLAVRNTGGGTLLLAPVNMDNDHGGMTVQEGTLQLGAGALDTGGDFLQVSSRNHATTAESTVATVDLMGSTNAVAAVNIGDNNTNLVAGSNGFQGSIIDSVGGGKLVGATAISYRDGTAGSGKLNGAGVISADIDLAPNNRTIRVEDGAADDDLTIAGTITSGAAANDHTVIGDGTLVIASTGSITGHDRMTFSNKLTRLESGAVTGTGNVFVQQRNHATEFSDFEPTLDINGQALTLGGNFIVSAYNATVVPATKSTRIIDSAGGGVITLGGTVVQNEGDNSGATSTILNRTVFIEADLDLGGANRAFDVYESLDLIDTDISGAILDDGTHNVTKNRAGTLRLSAGNNAYNLLLVNQGRVIITDAGALGDNDIQLGGNTTNGVLELDLASDQSLATGNQIRIGDDNAAGTRTGTGTIVNNGTGAVTFTNANFNELRNNATVNRTLTLDGSNTGANTIEGVIRDNGAGGSIVSLTKEGAGRWVLNGANTYTGATTVNAGCLEVNGSLDAASAVTVADGACLSGSGTIAGPVTLGTTATGITLDLDGAAGGLVFSSAVDTSNGVTVNITGSGSGVITVLDYNESLGTNNIDVSHFNLGTTATSDRGAGAFVDDGSKITIDLGFAGRTWNNASADGLWNEGAGSSLNWLEGDNLFFDGDSVTFGPTAAGTVTLSQGVAPGDVTIDVGANALAYVFGDNGGGETLTLGGTLTMRGDSDDADVDINCVIAGAGGLVRTESDTDGDIGTLTLAGANTYTGGTLIEQGQILITNNTALGTGLVTFNDLGQNPNLTIGAGVTTLANDLVFTATGSTKNLNFYQAAAVTLTGTMDNQETQTWATQIGLGTSSTMTISGVVSGTGGVRSRNGTLIPDNAANTFTGPLRVDQGGTSIVQSIANTGVTSHAGAGDHIVIGSDNTDGFFSYTGSGDSTDRQVQVGAAGGNTVDVLHSGGGTIASDGTGALVFTNATFTRQDTSSDGKVGARILTLAGSNADANEIQGAITDNGGTIGAGSVVDNTVSVVKNGAGTWALTGVNSYTGDTLVLGGILTLGDGTNNTALDDGADVSVETGAVLDLNYGGTDTIDELSLGGFPVAAGTWGATGSGATNIDDTHFTGTGTLTVTTGGGAYSSWTTANSLSGGDALASADVEMDGLVNLLEFGFGTDPNVADNAPLNPDGSANGTPTTSYTFSGGFSFKALFIRHDDFDDPGNVSYTVQFSGDLVNFYDSDATPVIETDSTDDPAYHVASVPYPPVLPDGKKASFYRVKVELVP